MEELVELKEKLAADRPDGWDRLPDIPLYMDQVVSYLTRQMVCFEPGDGLTSAMINNYIKDGLLSRANGKKYGQEHLAYLTAISALKQVLSVREMRTLVAIGRENGTSEQQYDYFCRFLDQALNQAAQQLDENAQVKDLPGMVLTYALQSYAHGLVCRRLLEIMAQKSDRTDLLLGGKKK
ncbi:DUF1836 domain-containing protein [Pseudoflavonifractor capillosus]|uniref:DUF1836 domain-containing protein n=1 Tax=Pseudoflavonifractor capillosus TaxID=106588 RepID=UPI00195C89C9|nr:DUF1836 domain-containing protein [Pseudoflavonifractor capillosus]